MNQSHGIAPGLPDWLPEDARQYLSHVEGGRSLRALARETGVHASTLLRRVRRVEERRDDPLVDAAIAALSGQKSSDEEQAIMTIQDRAALAPAYGSASPHCQPPSLRLVRRSPEGRSSPVSVHPETHHRAQHASCEHLAPRHGVGSVPCGVQKAYDAASCRSVAVQFAAGRV